jgi:predicted dehydrogenase
VELVLLATWPAGHLEQVRLCTRYPIRGILCERALAMNLAEGLEMRRVVADAGVLLMEGLMYRHHPQIQEAARLIQAGQIGKVGYITAYFCDRIVGTPDPENWRFKPQLGGGTMTAKACYPIDCLTFFARASFAGAAATGAAPQAAAALRADSAAGSYDIGYTGLISYSSGVTATFEANHRTVWREEIVVYGETGSIVIPHAIVTATQPREILLRRGGRFEREASDEKSIRFDVHDSYRLQLANMNACLECEAQPGVPLADSLVDLALTDALRTYAASGRVEPVREVSG